MALTTLKIELLTPMPRASVSSATSVKRGSLPEAPHGVADVLRQGFHSASYGTMANWFPILRRPSLVPHPYCPGQATRFAHGSPHAVGVDPRLRRGSVI